MVRTLLIVAVCTALLGAACSSSGYSDSPSAEPGNSGSSRAEQGTVYGGCFRLKDAMPGAGGALSGPLQLGVFLVSAEVAERWDVRSSPPPGATSTQYGADGMFVIQWFPGTYYLYAEADGKTLKAGPFVMRSGETTRVDLIMQVAY